MIHTFRTVIILFIYLRKALVIDWADNRKMMDACTTFAGLGISSAGHTLRNKSKQGLILSQIIDDTTKDILTVPR